MHYIYIYILIFHKSISLGCIENLKLIPPHWYEKYCFSHPHCPLFYIFPPLKQAWRLPFQALKVSSSNCRTIFHQLLTSWPLKIDSNVFVQVPLFWLLGSLLCNWVKNKLKTPHRLLNISLLFPFPTYKIKMDTCKLITMAIVGQWDQGWKLCSLAYLNFLQWACIKREKEVQAISPEFQGLFVDFPSYSLVPFRVMLNELQQFIYHSWKFLGCCHRNVALMLSDMKSLSEWSATPSCQMK